MGECRMKQNGKLYITRIVGMTGFFCLLLWIVCVLGPWVRPTDKDFDSWFHYYKEDKDTLNVIVIGSSAIYQYYIPPRAYKEYGYTSFMIAQSCQDIRAVPYIMEEALKTQDSDLIIVETRQAITQRAQMYEGKYDEVKANYYFSMVSTGMKPSLTRAKMIHKLLIRDENNKEIEWQFPLLKYHENFFDLTKDEWEVRLALAMHPYKSARQKSSVEKQAEQQFADNGAIRMTDTDKQNIDAIVQKAQELDVCLQFVSTPYIADAFRYPLQKDLDAYMEEMNYPYLNLNGMKEELGLDLDTDFYNNHHTNIAGANKVTDYLAEYLSTHYQFENKLNSTQKKDWDASVAAWKEKETELLTKWEENCKKQE